MMAPNFKPARLTAAERLSQRRRPIGYRDPIVRDNASNHPGLALAKGPTRADEKTEAHALEVAVIKAVRAEVFAASGICACCGDTERESAAKWPKAGHEMNEDPARGATRGWPAEERFNTRVCMRICYGCHSDYTRNLLRCLPLTNAGFAGPYDVQRKNSEREWETILTVDRQRSLRA